MIRRTFLATIPTLFLAANEPKIRYYGALPLGSNRVLFNKAFAFAAGLGKGKKAHLWKLIPDLTGEQQGEGDCVGHGYAIGCDILAMADILMRFEPERYIAKPSVEMIYGGSRVQIGKSDIWGSGSHGEWAAQYLKEYGVLHRLQYGDIDLRGYDQERSTLYGDIGVPPELHSVAREHPCATYTKVTSWDQARDALYVGQPVILCSSYAFTRMRDQHGFAQQFTSSGGRWRRYRLKWYHCMALVGYDETTSRPGGLIMNSWASDWITGPKRFDQPDGSFWATPEEIERMLQDWGDCFALSSYVGHPQKLLNHRLY